MKLLPGGLKAIAAETDYSTKTGAMRLAMLLSNFWYKEKGVVPRFDIVPEGSQRAVGEGLVHFAVRSNLKNGLPQK